MNILEESNCGIQEYSRHKSDNKRQSSTAWQPSRDICYFHGVSKNSRFIFPIAGTNSCNYFLSTSKNVLVHMLDIDRANISCIGIIDKSWKTATEGKKMMK